MLAAAHRLRRRSDFAATIRGGRRAARGALVVHVNQTPAPAEPAASPAPPRAGFVVSKAVGGAVERNRVKRRLRHLVRARIDTLPPGAMLVVRALPAAAERAYAELGADLDGALARATIGRRR
jgi:ribonuclease P protein component